MNTAKSLFLLAGLVLGSMLAYGYISQRSSRVTPATTTSAPGSPGTKLRITTSFYPLYYFTQAIIGDHAEVYNLTPTGVEPHDYEPTPQDIVRLQDSQIVIVNGEIEPWIGDLKNELIAKKIALVQTSEGLISQQITDEDGRVVKDPHIWLSPRIAQRIVERIEAIVSEKDPTHAADYHLRAESLRQQLVQLDMQFMQGLQACQQSRFITSHLAFGYLAADYGLTQVGIAGLSPDAEPSPRELADIVNFAKANQIKYIFFETLVNPRLATTLAREVGAQTLVLNPLEGLTDQDMAQGKDYFTEMQQNLSNLRLALACPALNLTK